MRTPIRIPVVGKTDANGNLTLPIKAQLAHHCSLNLAAKGTGTPSWEVDLDGSPELFGSGSKVVLGPMYTYPGQVITLVISAGQPNDQITGTLSGVQADTAEELQLAPGAPQVAGFTIGIVSGEFQVSDLKVTGLTGAATASRYVGATTGGPPLTGSFLVGDFVVDETYGILWICTVAGTPGTWKASGAAKVDDQSLSSGTVADFAIPSWATRMEIEFLIRSAVVANTDNVSLLANGDVTASYAYCRTVLTTTYSTTGIVSAQTSGQFAIAPGASSPAANFLSGILEILRPNSTGFARLFISRNSRNDTGLGGVSPEIANGQWGNTANAWTTVRIQLTTGPWASGTRIISRAYAT